MQPFGLPFSLKFILQRYCVISGSTLWCMGSATVDQCLQGLTTLEVLSLEVVILSDSPSVFVIETLMASWVPTPEPLLRSRTCCPELYQVLVHS